MKYHTATVASLLASFSLMALPAADAQDAPKAPPRRTATAPLDPAAIERASRIHLAYIASPSEQLNEDSRQGLEKLREVVAKRTSVDPAEKVIQVNIESDDISVYPMLYWPLTRDTQPLSAQAQKKLQVFLNSGGVLLMDVTDQSLSLDNSKGLRAIIGGVSIKPLTALPQDHTLKRCFYLVSSLPGSSDFGTVWVETPDPKRKENVSCVIIGENNWGAAWAGKTLAAGSDEHEKSLRAGVNMIFFAVTGNYKADQVHLPALLERLEK